MKKWKRGLKRIAAFTLAVILAGTTVDLSTFAVSAAEGTQTVICEHHTEHTADCGYVEAVEGSPCTHVHDETCGYDTVSGNEVCSHVHDEACGYAEAVEGTPCSYVCESCADEENEEQPENETAECTCGTDDDSIHATNCAVYVAPENPVCTCVEKCTEVNIWCDVCGFDYTQCGGTDTAVPYADCTCETKCTSDNVNSDCAVCSAEGADLTSCAGTDTTTDTTYPYAVVDTAAGTVTIDGTLGGKTTAEESDITALVDAIKGYVGSGITTITVTGSEPATIEEDNISMTAIGEAIFRLSGNGTHSADNQYNGKIDLILPDVTEIVDYEFQNAHALNSINLPKVTTIGVGGIDYCYYLQELTFGSVVTSIKEGSNLAFSGVGKSVDGGLCDLVLSCGQTIAATEYRPDTDNKMWWKITWKSITWAHSGGEATCTTRAVCAACGTRYGEVDPDNHTGTLSTYAPTADGSQHAATWSCCNKVETAAHTAEPTYTPNTDDSTKHDVTYSCCGATVTDYHSGDPVAVDESSHKYDCCTEPHTGMEDDTCDICWFEQYNVWVGSTRVTSLNKDDVLGDGTGRIKCSGPLGDTLTVSGNVTVSDSYNDGTNTYGIYSKGSIIITGDENSSLTVGGENINYGVYVESETGMLEVTGGMTLNATGTDAGIRAYSVNVGTEDSEKNDISKIYATGGNCGIRTERVFLVDTNYVKATGTGTDGVGIATIINDELSFGFVSGGHLIVNGTGGVVSSKNVWFEMGMAVYWRFVEGGSFECGDNTIAWETMPSYLEIIASNDFTEANGVVTCSHGVSIIDAAVKLQYTYDSSNYTLYFSSLQPAMDMIHGFSSDNSNIKLTLLKDVTVTDAPLTITKNLSLDLAGHQISGSINGALLEVADDADTTGALAITDSSTGKTGSISNTGEGGIGVQVSAGTFTIGGGKITGTKAGIYLADGVSSITVASADISGSTVDMETPGLFATAGTGVTLKADMFTSANDGYGVVLDSDGLHLKPDLSAAAVTVSPASGTYTGNDQTPTVTVKWGDTTLTNNSDYTVAWTDENGNSVTELKSAGTYTATITGKGGYIGDATKTFTIAPKPLTSDDVTITLSSESFDHTTAGDKHEPTVTNVVEGGNITIEASDYDVTYSNNTTPGTGKVIVTFKGNYSGTAEKGFTIVDKMAPTGEITINTNKWKAFLDKITFGLFFKDTVDVTVTADGTGSDVAKVEYLLSGEALIEENIPTEGWTELTAKDGKYSFTITSQNKTAVYVRITDVGNNVAVINSDGIVVYADSTISPETVNYVYKENADHTVQITMNGNTFVKLTDGDDKVIATDNYTMDTTTGELTLYAAYLDTLDVGTHTYKIYMNPQGVETAEVTLAYTFTVNVTAKKLTVTGATATGRDYDGTNTVEITDVALDGIESGDAVAVDLTGLQGTLSSANAGAYTSVTLPALSLTGDDAGNYTLVQPTGAVATSVEISKANAEITVGQTEYNKTFGNADFTLDVADNTPEADVTYSSSDEDVVTVSNGTVTIKGAGTATITVSLAESTNYNAADDKTITINVAKKSGYTVETINKNYLYLRANADTIDLAAYLPADCGDATYGTPAVTEGAVFSVAPAMSGSVLGYTVARGKVSDASQIAVTVSSDNYADFTITVVPVLVDRKPVSPKTDVTLTDDTITYGEALSEMSFETVVFEDEAGKAVAGTLAWKDAILKPDAGTTSATWVFTPENEEYATKEGSVAIVVKRATPSVVAPTVAERVYNPSVVLSDSDLTGGSANGVDGSVLHDTWSWKATGTIPVVDKSGYEAVFTPEDTNNYETVTRTITVKVERAAIESVSLNVTAPEAGEAKQTTVSSGADYSAALSWDCDTDTFGYNTAYTAAVTLTADDNHKFADGLAVSGWNVSVSADGLTATLTKTYEATRKEMLTGISEPEDVTLEKYYADAEDAVKELPATVTYTTESGSVVADIVWACENYDPTVKKTNEFVWTVKDGELADYNVNGMAVTGSITVTNADVITVNNTGTDKEISYNGSTYDVAQMFSIDENAGEASYAIVSSGTGEGTLNGSLLTITKAGTFEIKLTTEANAAYAAGEATATLTVNKGAGVGTVEIAGWTYGEDAAAVVVESDTNDMAGAAYLYESADDKGYSASTAPKNAGSYKLTVTLAENDLYKACTAEAAFVIAQKELTVKLTGSAAKVYDNTNTIPQENNLALEVDGIVDADDVTATASYAYDSVDAGTTKIHATDITLGGADAENYKPAATAVSAEVGKITKRSIADAEIVLGDALTYNGEDQTQSVSSVTVLGQKLDADSYAVTGNIAKEAGTYTLAVTVVNHKNFTGSATKEYTIGKLQLPAPAPSATPAPGATAPGTTAAPAGTPAPAGNSASAATPETGAVKAPATGDNSTAAIWTMVMLASLSAVLLVSKKKREREV